MRILKVLRLVLTFYRNLFPAAGLVTAICAVVFYKQGIGAFSLLFWTKASTSALVFYAVRLLKEKEFYYYQNLGVSRLFLWTSAFLLDFILFSVSLAATSRFR